MSRRTRGSSTASGVDSKVDGRGRIESTEEVSEARVAQSAAHELHAVVQESDGGDAAVPSGEEWPALGTSPSQESEPSRVWPASAVAQVPKINATDVQRMARVRNAGLIWDSLYTEVNPNDGNGWVGSSKSQRVARSPLATVSVVCTI